MAKRERALMGLVYHQWRQTVLRLHCISNMFVLSSYLLKVRHALRKPTRCAKKAEKMRLRFALSSAGCVVLSLFLVVAEAQDIRVNFVVDPAVGTYSTDDDTPLEVGLVAPKLSEVDFSGEITVTVRAFPPNDPSLRPAKLVDSPSSFPGDYTLLDPDQLLNGMSGSVDTFNVTFVAGSDFSSNFTIEIISDNTYEGIEYFMLEIIDIMEPAGFPAKLEFGTRSKVTVTVLDTDVLRIAFTEKAVELKEGESVPLMGVTAVNPFSVEVEVGVVCLELIGTGARPATRDVDFKIAKNATLRFMRVNEQPPILSSLNPSVFVEQDGVVEGTEAFLCVLAISVSPGQPLQSSDPDTITITILDIDELVVEWHSDIYSLTEGDGAVEVQLVAQGRYEIDFFLRGEPQTAKNTLVDGRALGLAVASSGGLTGDFVYSTVSFDFPANMASSTTASGMTLTVVDDDVLEDAEVFEGIFAIPVQVASQIRIRKGMTQVTSIIIEDDDVVEVSFATESYSVMESSGRVGVQLRVDGKYYIDFQVVVECRDTHPVSAEASVDYAAGMYTVTVSRPNMPATSSFKENLPNVTMTESFDVMIVRDGVLEALEEFECRIVNTSHSRVLVGSLSSVPVTIVDQDTVSVHFSQEVYIVGESSGPAALELVLEGTAAIPVIVTVGTLQLLDSSVGEEATATEDYTPIVFQTIAFQPGQTSRNFTVDILPDELPEPSEFFNAISNTSQLRVSLTAPSSPLVEITDDDSFVSISFDAVAYDVIEHDMMVQVCVSLSAAYFESVSVSLIPEAIAGDPAMVATLSDILATPSIVNFPAGTTKACSVVVAMDDNIVEMDEDFNVCLMYSGNQQGVTLGNSSVTTVTIINDDDLELAFERSEYQTSEGIVLFVVVTASGMSSFDYNFSVIPNDLTAKEDDDYTLQTQSFTYAGGTSVMAFTFMVDVLADNVFESSEQFELTLAIDQAFQDRGVDLGNPSKAMVTIEETEVLGVLLGAATLTITEGKNVDILVVTNSTFQDPFNVRVQLLSGSADDPEDFVSGVFEVTLDPISQEGRLMVLALTDNIIEPPETFTAVLIAPTIPGVVAIEPTMAEVTILDTTLATVMFSSPMVGVTEGDAVTLQLLLSAEVDMDVTFSINITMNPGTAEEMMDYLPTTLPVYFMGTNMASFQVVTVNDSVVEDTEEFTVHLVITQGAANLGISPGNPGSTIVEINDNDLAKVFFSQSSYSVSESNGSLLVVLKTSKLHSEAFNVIIAATEGSAKQSMDFSFSNNLVTFQPGEMMATVEVVITEDDILESTEFFTLTLMVPQATLDQKVGAGMPEEASVSILDNDSLLVSVTSPSVVTEGNSVTVTVNTDGKFTVPFNVTLTLNDETAIGGADFDVSGFPVTVTLFPGMGSVNISVTTTTDGIIECTECFDVVLSVPASTSELGVKLGSPTTVKTCILDADGSLSVSFDAGVYNTVEGTAATITLVANTSSYAFPFDIRLMFMEDDVIFATEGVDYIPHPTNVSFVAGQKNLSFEVDVPDDQVAELLEFFKIEISGYSSCVEEGLVADGRTFVGIQDNDKLVVSLRPNLYTVSEGDRVEVMLVTNIPYVFEFTIMVNTNSVTAIDGIDFEGGPKHVSFEESITSNGSAIVTFRTLNDSVFEGEEVFLVNLTAMDPNVGTEKDQGVVVIKDQTEVNLAFRHPSYVVPEGQIVVVTLESNVDIQAYFEVNISTVDGTAKAGVDYRALSGVVVAFEPGTSAVSVNITTIDDDVAERDEALDVTFDVIPSIEATLNIMRGTIGRSEVVIENNDALTVQFERSTYQVGEGDGVLDIAVVTNIVADFQVDFTIFARNGTATALTDFDITGDFSSKQSTQTAIAINTTRQTISVIISEDTILEGAENFTLELDVHGSGPLGITVAVPLTTVTILDNEPMVMVIPEAENYNVVEGVGFVEVCVVKTSISTFPLTLSVVVQELDLTSDLVDAARGNVDFSEGPSQMLLVAPAETRACFNITIIDDKIIELDELFQVVITSPTGQEGLESEEFKPVQVELNVTISDDDVLEVTFEQPSYSVNESTGMVTIGVIADSNASFPYNVRITSTEVTANNPSDFEFNPVRLTFNPGETYKEFVVPVADDEDNLEPDEQFILNLIIITVGGNSSKDVQNTTVTITDDKLVAVTFDPMVYPVDEGMQLSVILKASTPSVTPYSVEVVNEDVTAKAPDDYTSGPYTTTFPAGVTMAMISLLTKDDDVAEVAEKFNLKISKISDNRVVAGPENVAMVTIMDQDMPTVNFQPTNYTVMEGEKVQLVLVLDKPSATNLPVTIETEDGTASSPDDFTGGKYSITITAGSTVATILLPVNEGIVEGRPESFIAVLKKENGSAIGTNDTAYITIIDTTMVNVTFEPTSYDVKEGDTIYLTLKIIARLETSVTVTVETIPVTADNNDFAGGMYNVTFRPNTMMATLSIMTHSDLREEEIEMFLVIIRKTNIGNVGVGGSATVNIIDTTVLYHVRFVNDLYSVREGEKAMVQLCIEDPIVKQCVERESDHEAFRVKVLASNGTAVGGHADGEDYPNVDSFANFLRGTTTTDVDILTTEDGIAEIVETFTLRIIIPEELNDRHRGRGVVLGSINVTTIEIKDDDIEDLVLSFSKVDYTVREDEGPLEVVLTASRFASFEYSVTVTPTAESANAGEDFAPEPLIAVFAPGQREATVFLDIVDNAEVEPDEALILQMEVLGDLLSEGITVEENGQSMVTIQDNDVEVHFDRSRYIVNETEVHVILTIQARGDTSQDFTVTVNTVDGTATSQSDYTPGPYTIDFVRKQTQADVRILISNDELFEGPETFFANLSLSHANPRRASTVDPSEAEITIFDGSGMQGILRRVNDTIVGDPLYTVPLQGLDLTNFPELEGVSLCYEFHGLSNTYYSVVSDACTTVNAHYTAGKNDISLNVVSEIGVIAQGENGTCHQIRVTVDQCQPFVNERSVSNTYSMDGVRVVARRSRVRVRVPNCASSRQLVMWIMCEQRSGEDMIRFVIARGQGLTPTSHGLLAQFWNIPMEYKRYSGPFGGRTVTEEAGLYEVTVQYPGSPARTFLGDLQQLTWEQRHMPCLYAGNSFGGRIYEAFSFDGVIEGSHQDYEIAGIFDHNFTFDRYSSNC